MTMKTTTDLSPPTRKCSWIFGGRPNNFISRRKNKWKFSSNICDDFFSENFLYELHYQQSEVFELGEYSAWGHSSQGTISKKQQQQQQKLAFDLNFQSQCHYNQHFNTWYTLKGNIGSFQLLLCMLYVWPLSAYQIFFCLKKKEQTKDLLYCITTFL